MSGDEREDYGAIVVVPDGIPIRLGRAFESTDLNDYQKLKAFCLKWRIKIHQCETLSQEIIWKNFEWAIWGAMRQIGGANMPCYPAKNHNARLQALDAVIDWCEQKPEPTQVAPVDPQKEIRAEALAAVVAGGLAGITQAAVSLPAGDRVSKVMRSMCASGEKYYLWTADDWAVHLKSSKKTITGCVAWKEIMKWREAKKQTAMPVKTAMQKAELSRRKQHKKLAD